MPPSLPALALWLMALLSTLLPAAAFADTLAAVKERGVLVAGVKADYEPFGFRRGESEIIGFDADVAADLAASIGVSLRLVPVTSANRLQKLAAGEVDVLVATLGDTIDRRRLARMIEPGYYGGGASVMVPEQSPIRTWADVRGKALCAVQGALWNRIAAARLLAEIRAFNTTRDAELALRDGGCDGWLFDEAALRHRVDGGDWPDYRLLPADFIAPWAIAVAEEGTLAQSFDETVAGWLRDGHLKALETRWRLPPARYLETAGELWSRRDRDGQYHCRRQNDGRWPADCRDLDLIEAQELGGIGGFVLGLRDHYGLDFTPFYDGYSRDLFLRALATTLLLALLTVVGSLIAGVLGALLLRLPLAILRQIAGGLLAVMRMTPPLLQLYILFFGVGALLAAEGFSLGATTAAVIVLSCYAGSANAVALAEALATVGGGAGAWRRAARLAFPTVMGSCINIVKATAMASAIAVPELVHASTAIIADHGNPGVMMNILLACYVGIVLLVVWGFHAIERRVLAR